MITTKLCTTCNTEKPATTEYFYKDIHSIGGFRNPCKVCWSRIAKEKYKNDPSKRLAYSRKYAEEHPNYSKDYYYNHKDEVTIKQKEYYKKNREHLLEYSKNYVKEHHDEVLRKAKIYYFEHKETRLEYSRVWRNNNRKHISEYSKLYNIKHNTEVRKRNKKYREEHKEELAEKSKIYHKKHPEVYRECIRRRRSRKANLPFNFTKEDEQFALNYWDYKCAICGKKLNLSDRTAWAMDHWIALSDPRPDNPGTVKTNMLPMCNGVSSCNLFKHNNDPIEWVYRTFPETANKILDDINTYFKLVILKTSDSNS